MLMLVLHFDNDVAKNLHRLFAKSKTITRWETVVYHDDEYQESGFSGESVCCPLSVFEFNINGVIKHILSFQNRNKWCWGWKTGDRSIDYDYKWSGHVYNDKGDVTVYAVCEGDRYHKIGTFTIDDIKRGGKRTDYKIHTVNRESTVLNVIETPMTPVYHSPPSADIQSQIVTMCRLLLQ